MRLFILGASGGVGRCLIEQALARGHAVTAQSRSGNGLQPGPGLRIVIGQPADAAFLGRAMAHHDAVVICVGTGDRGPTTLFSDVTASVLQAMQAAGVRRLVAVTGVGAGDSRGHGGWLYNRVIFPLFTRNRYRDKDRQEAMIRRSATDWTIVRPAPFARKATGRAPEIFATIPAGLQLRAITRPEVADFILTCLEQNGFLHQTPFIGHR